jgi:hypothetical protein
MPFTPEEMEKILWAIETVSILLQPWIKSRQEALEAGVAAALK